MNNINNKPIDFTVHIGFVFLLLLFLFSGFRSYSIGTDTVSYVDGFLDPVNSIQNRNIGYNIITSIIRMFLPNGRCFLIITSFFLFYFANKTFQYPNTNYTYSVLCYFFLYFFTTLNILRQSIIMLVFFSFGISFLKKKKYDKVIILILFLVTIHELALIFFLIIILSKINFRFSISIILWIFSLVFLFVYSEALYTYLFSIISDNLLIFFGLDIPNYFISFALLYDPNISIKSALLYNFIFLLLLLFNHIRNSFLKENELFFKIFLFGIILQNFTVKFEVINRISFLLLYSIIPLSSWIFKKNHLLGYVLILQFFLIFIIRYIINGNAGVINIK